MNMNGNYSELRNTVFFGRKSFYVSSCIIQRVRFACTYCKKVQLNSLAAKRQATGPQVQISVPKYLSTILNLSPTCVSLFRANIKRSQKSENWKNRNGPLISSWMQIEWQFARKLGLSKFKIAFRAKLRTSASRIKFYEKANLNSQIFPPKI